MSLLSETAHTPDRILALMKNVQAMGADATRDAVSKIMDPKGEQGTAFTQTLRAAVSLGLVGTEQGGIQIVIEEVPASHAAFADLCYDVLLKTANIRAVTEAATDGNALLLAAYAVVCKTCDQRRSLSWFCDEFDREAFADEVGRSLSLSETVDGAFNTTRIVPWRRWMQYVGLLEDVGNEVQFPDATRRLKREIERSKMTQVSPWAARDFLAWVRDRMPFLPGGTLFVDVTGEPARQADCGVVLSAALRSLRDEGFLALRAVGDSSGHALLASDDADVTKSFSEISFPAHRTAP